MDAPVAGKIVEINGPIVTVHLPRVLNGEQVRIGRLGLVGEVIGRNGTQAVVQVYESTESLRPGEDAEALGHGLLEALDLGPEDEVLTLEHARHRLHELLLEGSVLCCEIEERDLHACASAASLMPLPSGR